MICFCSRLVFHSASSFYFPLVFSIQYSCSIFLVFYDLWNNIGQFIYSINQLVCSFFFLHERTVLMYFWQKYHENVLLSIILEFMMFICLSIVDLYLDHLLSASFLYCKVIVTWKRYCAYPVFPATFACWFILVAAIMLLCDVYLVMILCIPVAFYIY